MRNGTEKRKSTEKGRGGRRKELKDTPKCEFLEKLDNVCQLLAKKNNRSFYTAVDHVEQLYVRHSSETHPLHRQANQRQ